MNEIPLKSFLGQNSSFLRGSSALLIEDIENILDEFEFVHLDSDDRKIIEKITHYSFLILSISMSYKLLRVI